MYFQLALELHKKRSVLMIHIDVQKAVLPKRVNPMTGTHGCHDQKRDQKRQHIRRIFCVYLFVNPLFHPTYSPFPASNSR